jgi:uracil phosphoribosyltransferase
MYLFSKYPSIANTYIAELRDINIQKDRLRFRKNLERIGEIIGYEISKTLEYEMREVETPMGIAQSRFLKDRVILSSILRAGLPLHQGLLNVFDKADNAFVSAYRMHHKDGTFEINLEYTSCPNLNDAVLILADPMLATGSSIDVTIRQLLDFGTPKKIHVVTAIASVYGYEYIKRLHPDVSLWIGDLDEELTAKSYIVPGLGDAGDLAYGSKLQD